MQKEKKINPQILEEIRKVSELSNPSIYRKIQEKKKDPRILDRSLAALVLAVEFGVDIASFTDDSEKNWIRSYYGNHVPFPLNEPRKTTKTIKETENIVINLNFIKNSDLRKILNRDLKELNVIQNQGIKNVAKTCIILAGSIAEALILDALKQKTKEVNKYLTKKGWKNLDDLVLYDLVNIAVNINPPLLDNDIVQNINQIRNWRNLIHPGREISKAKIERIKPSEGRARTAMGILHLISEELNENI